MFANTFPIGPAISFVINLFEIYIKLISMCYYTRRGEPQGASGIGVWL